MKIRLDRDVLAEAVQWAARSLPTRPSVPILAGLLVKASANQVVMSSFDYETSAQITVKAEVADDGVALVSGRLLADIARSLPNKPVDITADETKMETGLRHRAVHPADPPGRRLPGAARDA